MDEPRVSQGSPRTFTGVPRRCEAPDPKVVDAVEVAWNMPGVAVTLRGTLSLPTIISSGAWALRAPAIAQLAAVDGPLRPTLFDETNLVEIQDDRYPDERLIACRNPFLADERRRRRGELLAATENDLTQIAKSVADGRLTGEGAIGVRIGKILDRRRMAKHFELAITDTTFAFSRREDTIAAEAALDGIHVVRTPQATTGRRATAERREPQP